MFASSPIRDQNGTKMLLLKNWIFHDFFISTCDDIRYFSSLWQQNFQTQQVLKKHDIFSKTQEGRETRTHGETVAGGLTASLDPLRKPSINGPIKSRFRFTSVWNGHYYITMPSDLNEITCFFIIEFLGESFNRTPSSLSWITNSYQWCW